MTNDTLAPENGVTCNNIEANDTREQLEADVRKCITSFQRTLMYPDSANKTTEIITTTVDTVFGWLDRQEAITVDECFVQSKTGADSLVLWENCRLQENLDELQAAFDRACAYVADTMGTCPGDAKDYDRDCENVCHDQLAECWRHYFEHVQQDTVESVLEDFVEAFDAWDNECNHDRDEHRGKLFSEYAERIRSVVEHVAELCNEEHGGILCVPNEPVVRCKYCAHYAEHAWITASNGLGTDICDVCYFWHSKPTKVEPNGFCAWGIRKAVEHGGID